MFNARRWATLMEAAQKERRVDDFWDDLSEEMKGHAQHEYSIRSIFESFVPDGREIVSTWSSYREGGERGLSMATLMEAGTDTSAFSNITGQIVYNAVLEKWNSPQFIADQLMRTVPTSFLDGEKIAGISQIGDEATAIGEGQPYPTAGVSEEYVETPRTVKNGMIVPLTKEAIIADRTGLLTQRASDVSEWLRVNKEKRCLDTALGLTDSYKRNGGSAQATYGNTHTEGDFDNLSASTGLEDWSDIEAAELLFDGMTDPNTGEPIVVMPNQIVVPTALKHTARRILSATETREVTNTNTTTLSPNTLDNYQIVTSAWVKNRTSSATTWFIGEFSKAFAYMEVWPITSVQAPTNSEMEFTHDIIQRYKVSERGVPAVLEPRYVVKCTA